MYKDKLTEYGDLMTIEVFKTYVDDGFFIDYDGYGRIVKDKLMGGYVKTSRIANITDDETHIMWYNR